MYAKEKMKKGVKIRLIVMSLSAVLPIILLILFDLPFFKDRFVVYSDLFVLRYAIFVLLEGYIVFKIYRYIRFFCDVEYADLFVLRKTDERLNFVRLKTNAIVFYTILCMMIAVLLMYLFVYLYYSRKY